MKARIHAVALQQGPMASLLHNAVLVDDDDADAVWQAENDLSGRLRFPAGADAIALARDFFVARRRPYRKTQISARVAVTMAAAGQR